MKPPFHIYGILLSLFLFTKPIQAANPYPIFHLDIENGLSNNSVKCIFQDSQGFMWFGTYDGLNRYDGYEFKTFRNKLNDPTSLPHNYIYTITEDHQNQLWIGTGQGVAIYHPVYNQFTQLHYRPYWSKEGEHEALKADIKAIAIDPANNAFIGTNGWGLLIKYAHQDIATWIPTQLGKSNEDTYFYHVSTMHIDQKQRVWLFVQGKGLCQFDYQKHAIVPINAEVSNADCMLADNRGNLWLGNNTGLYQYNVATNQYVKHFTAKPGELNVNAITDLATENNTLWISTRGGGINILDLDTQTFTYLLPEENGQSLDSKFIFTTYIDQEARKWIGSVQGGISIIDIQKNKFQTYTHHPTIQNSLVSNFVNSFLETSNGNVWIGTDGGGLSIWNRQAQTFQALRNQSNDPYSLSNNAVTGIIEDYLGTIWIATNNGINQYNKTNHRFKRYPCINQETGEENHNIEILLEDQEHTLWATTFSNGKLYKLNRTTDRFEAFNQKLIDLIALADTKDDYLWAGDSHRLFQINKRTANFEEYEIGKPIRFIYPDKNHQIWIGTEGKGLLLFDTQTYVIKKSYADDNGLCNNSVLTILPDNHGNLWLSTFNGLAKFNPVKEIFTNYYQGDGLQSNQFSYRAALKLSSGEMVFGGVKGFNIFYPDRIQPRSYQPPVAITNIRIDNQALNDTSAYTIQIDSTNQINRIVLPYHQATISLDFAALEYSSAEKIKYTYFLDGWDKKWNQAGNNRTVNYNNISEGDYVLHLRSTNAEGVWNKHETLLYFTVLPPWYRTWWAYFCYAFIICSLLAVYIYYKSRQAKLEYEIKLTKLHAEKEKEINEKRQSFFTNISHEFRTPLTLIISPIKDMLRQHGTHEQHETQELNVVYRNAKRLLSLVDQLLLFRKAEEQDERLRINKLNFSAVCKEIYLCFVHQAKAQNIHYIFECNNPELTLYADREKMEIIFYNLLSNALKFTPAGGSIIFRVEETDQEIHVQVVDSGSGIPAAVGDKLFEKFYQEKRSGVPKKPGFGIGLYLVKNFVQLHQGTVDYTSAVGKGTTFQVSLLKGYDHFEEFVDTFTEVEQAVILNELTDDVADGIHETEEVATTPTFETIVSKDKSILVVDDDEQIRKYLVQLFQDQYLVYAAASGEEALQIVKKQQPDIVVSDIMMGEMSGIQLCHAIKSNAKLNHIQVILLTSSSSPAIQLEGVEEGADDYVTKPFDKEILKARVSNLLKNRQNLQQFFYNAITLQSNDLKVSEKDKEFIEQCITTVEKYMDDSDFSVKKLTLEVGMSHSNLYKRVKAISGKSINEFIRFIRLRKAAELFINTDLKVNEAASRAGFYDIKYFREQFSKLFGMNPSDYIKKYRKPFQNDYQVNPEMKRKEEG